IPFSPTRAHHLRRNWPRRLQSAVLQNLIPAAVVFGRLLWRARDPKLRREYCRRLAGLLRARRDPGPSMFYVIKCAMHHHHYTLARQMAKGSMLVNTI